MYTGFLGKRQKAKKDLLFLEHFLFRSFLAGSTCNAFIRSDMKSMLCRSDTSPTGQKSGDLPTKGDLLVLFHFAAGGSDWPERP